MTPIPDSVSTFIRFIQLKSLRKRTEEEYVRWVTRLARQRGVACASLPVDAAIHEALGAFELPLQCEFKVRVVLPGREEVVLCLLFLQRAGDERAVLDAPDGVDVALPAVKSLAVEKRHGRCVNLADQGE
jgi:hypothetical protein